MPNWCKCTLTVTGAKKPLAAFVKAARGFDRVYAQSEVEKRSLTRLYQSEPIPPSHEEFCFHALVPVPAEMLERSYDRVAYDWEVRHWGCKWGALDIKVIGPSPMPRGCKVIYKFRTANSAPTALLDKVASDHPTLVLVLKCRYEQEGTVTTTWKKGSRG